jgi:hypothetical protein
VPRHFAMGLSNKQPISSLIVLLFSSAVMTSSSCCEDWQWEREQRWHFNWIQMSKVNSRCDRNKTRECKR